MNEYYTIELITGCAVAQALY